MNEHQVFPENGVSQVFGTPMPWRVFRLMRKELSEILRDRRTIATLVLMPLLLYPLLSVTFQQMLLANSLPQVENQEIRVGFVSQEEQSTFDKLLKTAKRFSFPDPKDNEKSAKTEFVFVSAPGMIGPDFLKRLHLGQIDIAIQSRPVKSVKTSRILEWEIYYRKDSLLGAEAALEIENKFGLLNAVSLLELAITDNLPRGKTILGTQAFPVPRDASDTGFPLETLIPLILIMMTITGAVYPAIDLTAGERERGTLEILIAAPVPRLELLFAKYVSVLTVAVLTAMVNLVMMTATLWATGLGQQLFGASGLTPLMVVQVFAILLLFAAFFSAVLLTITSFARSFKEAQAYLIPLMLVSLAPGLASLLIKKLTPELSLVPLLNVVLLGQEMLRGTASLISTLIVVVSTLLYAVLFIAMAARVFGSENVLYNEQNSWSDLVQRPFRPRGAASVSNTLICLIVIFSSFFLIQGLLSPKSLAEALAPDTILQNALLLPGLSILLFAIFPVLVAWRRNIYFIPGFELHSTSFLAVMGAGLLGLSLWPLLLEFLAFLIQNGWTTMNDQQRAQLVESLREVRRQLPLGLLLAIQVIPAVVEEFFFRGYLFSALRKTINPWLAILASGFLFGIFHLVTEASFGMERFLPSTLLGIVLGWICWRSGSVFPSMIMHALHNGMLVYIGSLQTGEEEAIQMTLPQHIPILWLILGAIGTIIGVSLLLLNKKKHVQTNYGGVDKPELSSLPSRPNLPSMP